MPDWTDLEALWLRHPAGQPSGITPDQWAAHLRGAHAVAGQMAELIRSEPWATWTAHLETLCRGWEAELAALVGQLWTAVGDEADRLRARGTRLQALIEGVRLALDLPADLMRRDDGLQPPVARETA